jgi:hypothetical protein
MLPGDLWPSASYVNFRNALDLVTRLQRGSSLNRGASTNPSL